MLKVFLLSCIFSYQNLDCQKIYSIGDIQVVLIQKRKEYSCFAKIITYREQILLDSLSFDIEAVGGRNGISKAFKLQNKLVFSKHGDYDGRTIIIDHHGKITNVLGGILFYDSTSNLLLSIYESDIGGVTIYDLDKGVLLFEKTNFETYPTSFVKDNNENFFMLSEGHERTTDMWFKLDIKNKKLSTIDLSDLESKSFIKLNQINDANVNCRCSDSSATR